MSLSSTYSCLGTMIFDADILCRYIPDGQSKFGAIEIQSPQHGDQSILHYRLFINGEEVWTHTIPSPPPASNGLFDGTWV